MSLEKITHSKSAIASIGIHAFAVACVSIYYYIAAPKSLELTGLGGGTGKLISLSSVSFIPSSGKPASKAGVASTVEKSKAVVKPDPNAKKIAKTENTVQDTVREQAAAVSQSGAVGEGTGIGGGFGTGSGLSLGNGASDFDGGLLLSKIKGYLQNRLGSSLRIDEDQLIKIKLKLSRDGVIESAEMLEGSLELANLRKLLSAARNIPLKSYWQSKYTLPGELIIPVFLTSN